MFQHPRAWQIISKYVREEVADVRVAIGGEEHSTTRSVTKCLERDICQALCQCARVVEIGHTVRALTDHAAVVDGYADARNTADRRQIIYFTNREEPQKSIQLLTLLAQPQPHRDTTHRVPTITVIVSAAPR